MSHKIHVWDLPLRLFHWSLVLAIATAYVTGEIGGSLADWHGRVGVFVLGLLIFRLIWGFLGTTHARFFSFFPTPGRLLDYFNGRWQGHGHNPLGALSVFALLAIISALVATGLFSNDDIAFHGPFYDLVDKEFSDTLSGWHGLVFDVLFLLIGLHITAITLYLILKDENLIRPMVTGKKSVSTPEQKTGAETGWYGRFIVAALVAGGIAWSVHSGFLLEYLRPPVPPVVTEAPPAW